MSGVGRRRGLALAVALSLVTPLGTAPANAAPEAGGLAASDVACSAGEAETVAAATVLAQSCGRDVSVTGAMTPWDTTRIDGDTGQVVVSTSASAQRQDSDGDGAWAPVAVEIGALPDAGSGLLPVSGGVEPIWLNPGGAAGRGLPLAVIGPADRQVSMFAGSLPELPRAVVGTDRVSYELGDGVSLVVLLNDEGTEVTPVVRLADPAALGHLTELLGAPGGDVALDFPIETSAGLELRAAQSRFEITNSAGEVRFESGPALMWDSAGGGAGSARARAAEPDRLTGPVPGDNVARMAVTVSDDDVVTVTADAAALSGPDTVFPLHLDPTMGAHTPASWTMVQNFADWKDTPNWKFSDTQGLGKCDPALEYEWCRGVPNVQRLFYQFEKLNNDGTYLSELSSDEIARATFSVVGDHQWDCSGRSVDGYSTSMINSATVWDSQPTWYSVQERRTVTHRAGCTGRKTRIGFDVTPKVRVQADEDVSWITIGLKAADESSMHWWKRYGGASANIEIWYDQAPNPPAAASMNILVDEGGPTVRRGCTTDPATRPVIPTADPTLVAKASDPDGNGVWLQFRVAKVSNGETVDMGNFKGPVGPNTEAAQLVNAPLAHGGEYFWQARTRSKDSMLGTTRTLSWDDVPKCRFRPDLSKPNNPLVKILNYPKGQIAGGLGTAARVEASPNGSMDVDRMYWDWNTSEPNNATPATPGEIKSFTADVPRAGYNYLAVQSRDAAGRLSGVTRYEFYVGFPHATGSWKFNDAGWGSGTPPLLAVNSRVDSGTGSVTRTSDVEWSWGWSGTGGTFPKFPVAGETAVPDGALFFDSTDSNDKATTGGPVVGTDQSFAVSAFLRADLPGGATSLAGLGSAAAVSQEGINRSSFHLGYSDLASCPDGERPCWAFWMVDDDDAGAPNTTVRTDVQVVPGQWVHVVGVHDAATGALSAYACPTGLFNEVHRSSPQTDPVVEKRWVAGGPLRLGSGMSDGVSQWQWHGGVDEVRVYANQVLGAGSATEAEAKLRRICSGTETS